MTYCCEYFKGCMENDSFYMWYDPNEERNRFFFRKYCHDEALIKCPFCHKEL